MARRFQGKKFLVTGCGSGIGRSLCKKLYGEGATVFAVSKSVERLKTLEEECPGIQAVAVDLGNWDETRKVIKDIQTVDGLVNNAGIAIEDTFMSARPQTFDRIFDVNIKAVMNVSQIVADKWIQLKKHGSIVNISSMAAKRVLPTSVSYSVSKAALDHLTTAMALELGPYQIRVNSINPTIIMDTSMGDQLFTSEHGDKIRKFTTQTTPLKRLVEMEELLSPILFLLSEESSGIHAQNIYVDGGFSKT